MVIGACGFDHGGASYIIGLTLRPNLRLLEFRFIVNDTSKGLYDKA